MLQGMEATNRLLRCERAMSPESYSGNLGDMLLREGLVTNEALEEALRRQRETQQPLGRILVDMNAITESVKLSRKHIALRGRFVKCRAGTMLRRCGIWSRTRCAVGPFRCAWRLFAASRHVEKTDWG